MGVKVEVEVEVEVGKVTMRKGEDGKDANEVAGVGYSKLAAVLVVLDGDGVTGRETRTMRTVRIASSRPGFPASRSRCCHCCHCRVPTVADMLEA